MKRYNRELKELYSEPNIGNIMNPVDWDGLALLCEWTKTNCLKRYYGQTLEVNKDLADLNQDGLIG